ncbi:uncharacterized protein LOC127285327 isoform X2 [Leptopilina boulardi]|uniref:uncharacterized protein LOC127285327 isoform X1 n=1 Tax=Leptopilina boulardi TaxID=63433 RepID=UPI0021F5385E|nr:uncharacterized protein LOC127285327 isoform X1 [Leptopilina boulardi]XP_051167241.1 uncharacterized protein LOC127285327 isoform X2 [Leptopilina boulardi]
MLILTILNLLLHFYVSNADLPVKWNEVETERIVKPSVRKFQNSWKNNMYHGLVFHYKKHFGIIIRKDTTFTLTIESSQKIENLKFVCPFESSDKFLEINFARTQNSTRNLTTNLDCVPLLTVSYNVPVVVKIKTKNWSVLPVFDSKNLTFLTSHKPEQEFYKNIQTYGFVENHQTQMIVSAKDVKEILSEKLSLFVGLQNQADIIKYYNYLTGASRYVDKNDSLTYYLVDKQRHFFRTEINENAAGLYKSCWITLTYGVDDVLQQKRAKKWIELHEIAHYFDIQYDLLGFGPTTEIWTNIFAFLYESKFYSNTQREPNKNELAEFYQNSKSFEKWSYAKKLQFLMTLFAFDGTDKSFREFNIRYYSKKNKLNTITLILEVFLDLYNINVLPYLKKVLNFNTNAPIVNPDIELLLITGHPVMPAIDFNIKPAELKARSRENDWRPSLPLMLLRKMKKKLVDVTFTIESPIDLTNCCLYLNNICHNIVGNLMNIKLQTDVYSSFIAEEKNGKIYISDIVYHTISKETKIHLIVNEMSRSGEFLPLAYYEFHALGYNDEIFAKILINYESMTIGINQFFKDVHVYFKGELYFSISLERNGSSIFEYKINSTQEKEEPLINVKHKLIVNDKIHIYHPEPGRFWLHWNKYNELKHNTFVVTNVGLKLVGDNDLNISSDIKRIDEFHSKYNVDLSNNALYKFYFAHYIRTLRFNGLEKYIPNAWVQWQTENVA